MNGQQHRSNYPHLWTSHSSTDSILPQAYRTWDNPFLTGELHFRFSFLTSLHFRFSFLTSCFFWIPSLLGKDPFSSEFSYPIERKESQTAFIRLCFLARVEHVWALCFSNKWSDWKKCYMRTSRSNRESGSPFLVSHLFLRNQRSEWFSSFFPNSRRSYTIGILRINWSTYMRDRC